MSTNLPFPVFRGIDPSKNGFALSAVGACRIYPHLFAPDLYGKIVENCLNQGTMIAGENKEVKALRKEGVSMIFELLTVSAGLDPSIVDVEVFLRTDCCSDNVHGYLDKETFSTLASMFLDAGANRIVLCGVALEAMSCSRLPRNRLVAHFDRPFSSSFSAKDEFEVSFKTAKDALVAAAEYVDTVSVNFLSKSAAVEASKLLSNTSTIIETMVSVQDVQDLVQMLLSVQKDIRLVVQLAPLAVRNTDSDATDELAKEGEEQPHHKLGDDSHYQKGGEIGDRFEIEERVISHLTTTVSSIMTSTVADHVRIALVDPSPKEMGMALAECIKTDRDDKLFTTVVVNRNNEALGLVYSSKASLAASLECGRGVYYSRSRGKLWRKGDTSGHYQVLHRIDVDCDGDALRFTVTQKGQGAVGGGGHFCHLETITCWGQTRGLRGLEETLYHRLLELHGEESAVRGSYTRRLFEDDTLLRNKLVEEAQELAEATDKKHVAEELADVLYFAMVKAVKEGVSIDDAIAELDRRTRKVTRRPGNAKAERIAAGDIILGNLDAKKDAP
jgi:phosphoribosyl-ATP pyrophosphohydrolase/phosphoribosyl-AMP cyclohydrolase/histidinol dehydrogenase